MNVYKEFWNDSGLVLVVPIDHIFYAQRVCDLECKEKYNPSTDFLKIEEIFLRIKPDDISHFKSEALSLMHKTENKNPHK